MKRLCRLFLFGVVFSALCPGTQSLGQVVGQGVGHDVGQRQATPEKDSTATPTLADAKALAAKGQLDRALAELAVLSKAEPEEAGVERLRGVILYQKELLPEAESAFARAVAQNPSDRQSQQMRGITLYRLGKPGEAIPLLEKAHAMAGGAPASQSSDVGRQTGGTAANQSVNADPQYVLGLCYTDARRYDDARRAFAEQFGFGADSAEAYLVAGRLFLRREFADEAARFAGKALELNPALPLAHQLLGEIALAKADLPLAVKELEAERKLNPLNGPMYDRLGDAYVRSGQFEEARVALNKAVLLEPNATGPYILLGEALIKLGEPIQALHYLARAVKMDPGNSVTHTILGQAYRALGRTADANREYKLAVEIQHRNDPKPTGEQ
jgi:predicted Zn-dependent protease